MEILYITVRDTYAPAVSALRAWTRGPDAAPDPAHAQGEESVRPCIPEPLVSTVACRATSTSRRTNDGTTPVFRHRHGRLAGYLGGDHAVPVGCAGLLRLP